jgi:competence protein ComEC
MNLENLKNNHSENLTQPLINNSKDILLFFIFLGGVFFISIYIKYIDYSEFSKFSIQEENVLVLNQYQKIKKNSKKYWVLKLKIIKNNFEFYTVNYNNIKDLRGRVLKVRLFMPDEFTFYDFLKGNFIPSNFLKIYSNSKEAKYQFFDQLSQIHEVKKIQEFYGALFFSTAISNNLRTDLTKLGVNHLVVLSGFHVGLIALFLYFLFGKFYNFFHVRYFPYRNKNRDLLVLISIFLIIYLIFLQVPDSFLRAVTMFLFWFYLFDRNIIKNKFTTLVLTVFLLIALFPDLFFSVGFWFSVSGVFYILLFLKYFEKINKYLLILLINIWVFVALMPIVHFVFFDFSLLNFLSPIFTILFSVFYPAVVILHILFLGDLLDKFIIFILEIPSEIFELKYYLDEVILYIFISFLAILNKDLFYILIIFIIILNINKIFNFVELDTLETILLKN